MSKLELSQINREFHKQVNNNLKRDDFVIAGISGGPDSMLLLYLLHRAGIKTVSVHCNYGLRGKASDQDQKLVEQMSSMWEIECVSVRLDSEEAGDDNFQNWARKRRYEIFYDLKREYQANYITTAHHQDDQVETILQKILRGSGTAAWKGMSVKEDDLFRPLLGIGKDEIMQFVQEFNIPYRIDGTNEESTYARNFLRHNWFPELNRFFPGWKDNLLKIPNRAEEFESMADHILSGISEHPDRLNRSGFLSLPETIRPVILHRFIEKNERKSGLSHSFLSNIESLEELQTGKAVQISKYLSVERDRDLFIVVQNEEPQGDTGVITIQRFSDSVKTGGLKMSLEPCTGKYKEGVLYLDVDKISFPLTLRNWQKGDVIKPLGMAGSQLISDHLTNRKIWSSKKDEAKVLETFDGMICALIFPHKTADFQQGTVSEEVRCTSETKTVVTISKE
jgi:tRNA(Ile)-lysidine synthase